MVFFYYVFRLDICIEHTGCVTASVIVTLTTSKMMNMGSSSKVRQQPVDIGQSVDFREKHHFCPPPPSNGFKYGYNNLGGHGYCNIYEKIAPDNNTHTSSSTISNALQTF